MSEDESDRVSYTHEQLMEITTITLNELLAQDTFLSDLPKGVILEEVNNQIALQYGKSITVYVMRADGERMPVIVPQAEGTLSDLKKSIRRYISLKLSRSRKRKRQKLISWKYIWRTYHLKHNECLLTDNSAKLSDLGIKNKSYVEFVKRRRKQRICFKHCQIQPGFTMPNVRAVKRFEHLIKLFHDKCRRANEGIAKWYRPGVSHEILVKCVKEKHYQKK